MPAKRDADTASPPLIRFILLVAPGFLGITLLAWSLATWGPNWVPDGEGMMTVLGSIVVFAAALRARLGTLPAAAAAAAISVILNLLIYYGPLLYLMDASYNRVLVLHLAGIAGTHAASYALAVAAAFLVVAVLNRKAKME